MVNNNEEIHYKTNLYPLFLVNATADYLDKNNIKEHNFVCIHKYIDSLVFVNLALFWLLKPDFHVITPFCTFILVR